MLTLSEWLVTTAGIALDQFVPPFLVPTLLLALLREEFAVCRELILDPGRWSHPPGPAVAQSGKVAQNLCVEHDDGELCRMHALVAAVGALGDVADVMCFERRHPGCTPRLTLSSASPSASSAG